MSIEVKVLKDGDEARWDEFVFAHERATFFHRAGWKQVLKDSFSHPSHYLYTEKDGRITGILPLVRIRSRLFANGLISLPFCVGGGPLSTDEESRAALDSAAEGLMRKTGAEYLEYRGCADVPGAWQVKDDLYFNFAREMPEEEAETLKAIPRKQRAVVRKALKSDLTWRIERDIEPFFSLYAASLRNLGTPAFPRSLFRNLLSVFGEDCDILTVYDGQTPLSSVMSFYFRDRVMPYYTGAAPAARRLGGADLMYWRLMRQAIENGRPVFDFGRSKAGTGPFSFKKNWGFTPEPIPHAYLMRDGGPVPEINPNNPKYRLFIAAWKKLPVGLANLLGPLIVRNIG